MGEYKQDADDRDGKISRMIHSYPAHPAVYDPLYPVFRGVRGQDVDDRDGMISRILHFYPAHPAACDPLYPVFLPTVRGLGSTSPQFTA